MNFKISPKTDKNKVYCGRRLERNIKRPQCNPISARYDISIASQDLSAYFIDAFNRERRTFLFDAGVLWIGLHTKGMTCEIEDEIKYQTAE